MAEDAMTEAELDNFVVVTNMMRQARRLDGSGWHDRGRVEDEDGGWHGGSRGCGLTDHGRDTSAKRSNGVKKKTKAACRPKGPNGETVTRCSSFETRRFLSFVKIDDVFVRKSHGSVCPKHASALFPGWNFCSLCKHGHPIEFFKSPKGCVHHAHTRTRMHAYASCMQVCLLRMQPGVFTHVLGRRSPGYQAVHR